MADYFDDLIIGGADFNHIRLAELIKLADQAEPFYLWVEKVFRHHTGRADSLEKIVKTASREDIKAAIIGDVAGFIFHCIKYIFKIGNGTALGFHKFNL